ncbi:MFS transporter [Salinithrix halophila]|uniref:MFS transporter n=1 Tax=Salinithrix halophila TaxID=1485204 RepID=A0ABV8JGX2_9BACL
MKSSKGFTLDEGTAIEGTYPKAGKKEWIGLVVLTLPTLLLAIDVTVLHLALPHLVADLQANSTEQLWILDIYAFMIAGFLVTMGTLGDRIGRRRLLMIGASAFGIASVAAAFSVSPGMLIATRAFLGIAGATLMPSTLSLIRNMFKDPKQRAVGISVWVMCFTVGAAIGPVVGGLILEYYWWGSVFLLGVPIMLLLLITAPFLLPEYRNDQAGKLDLLSVLLSLGAMLPFIYAVKQMARYGLEWTTFLSLVVGVLLGWLFVRRQGKLSDPLLDIRLFRNPAFSGALVMLLIDTMVFGAFFLFFAQYLQMVKEFSPFQAGLLMLPGSVGSIIGSLMTPWLARCYQPRYVISFGLVIASSALLLLGQIGPDTSLAFLTTVTLFLTLGSAPMMVLLTDLIIGLVPPEKAGSASSLSETSSELGMALGVATIGSIGMVMYRIRMEVPSGVPPEVAAVVEDNLAGAASVADQIPDHLREEVIRAAQLSFTDGFNIASIVSAVIIALIAMIAFKQFRGKG